MNKVTIETINGKKCTVIRKKFDAEWVKEQLSTGNGITAIRFDGQRQHLLGYYSSVPDECKCVNYGGTRIDFIIVDNIDSILTILLPLPRYPKPEDAPLLYRYMAEGLYPCKDFVNDFGEEDCIGHNGIHNQIRVFGKSKITHATLDGERVEIAIEEKNNE